MPGKLHKKPKSIHTASAGRLLSWLQGESKIKNMGEVHHDRNEAGTQHNTTLQYSKLIIVDTRISQVAYKRALLMQTLQAAQGSSS